MVDGSWAPVVRSSVGSDASSFRRARNPRCVVPQVGDGGFRTFRRPRTGWVAGLVHGDPGDDEDDSDDFGGDGYLGKDEIPMTVAVAGSRDTIMAYVARASLGIAS